MSFLNLRKPRKEEPVPVKKLVAKEAAVKKSVAAEGATGVAKGRANPHVLLRPHITEKASASSERGAYVFRVATDANKREIARAVSLLYKVTPVKVRAVNIPKKSVFVKGRAGFRGGGKKAYVFLKKGEKIEVM
ncbi:MAG: 50S ribosomal protein L23 [Patescibacteria group bacterium]